MKSLFSNPFASLIFFTLFFCIHGFTSQNLIQQTCTTCSEQDPNIDFVFCKSSLQSVFTNTTSSKITLHTLGKISIKLISYNVTNTTSYIKNLLKNKRLDPFVKECLGDCLEMYKGAIFATKQAVFCYNSSRYLDANTQISSIMDAADTCEGGFSEKPGIVSPLTVRNNYTFQLSALSLELMHMLQT